MGPVVGKLRVDDTWPGSGIFFGTSAATTVEELTVGIGVGAGVGTGAGAAVGTDVGGGNRVGVAICIIGVGIGTGVGVGSDRSVVIVATGVGIGPEGAMMSTDTYLLPPIVNFAMAPRAQSAPDHFTCDPGKSG